MPTAARRSAWGVGSCGTRGTAWKVQLLGCFQEDQRRQAPCIGGGGDFSRGTDGRPRLRVVWPRVLWPRPSLPTRDWKEGRVAK